MSIPRVPRDSDPRRPPRREVEIESAGEQKRPPRSYGQLAPTPESIDEFEDVTGEVAHEGDDPGDDDTAGERVERKERRQIEEFEELTEEPVREEDPQ